MEGNIGWDGRDIFESGDFPEALACGLRAEMGMLSAVGGIDMRSAVALSMVPLVVCEELHLDCLPFSWRHA